MFPKNGHKMERLPWYGEFRIAGLESRSKSVSWTTTDLQLFLPVSLDDELTLLAVWTKGTDSQAFGYMGQFWKFLQIHREELSHRRTLVMGDFNSNAIWDKSDRWWSHSDCVDELAQAGLKSAYHHHFGEAPGQETVPTFFLQRNTAKPYHIDYAFCSEDLLPGSSLKVGACDDWIQVSDHVPLLLTVHSGIDRPKVDGSAP
jgi:exodeoxyribonuclease-3